MSAPDGKYWNKELETLPREQLEAKQLEDLKEIVQFAYHHAPYYKRSFDEAGVKPSDIHTLKDIQKFPFINKKTQRDTQGVGSFLGELAAVRLGFRQCRLLQKKILMNSRIRKAAGSIRLE